jgi:hypothetical protein
MPRGLGKIKEIAKEAQARKAAFDEAGPGVRFFSINDGETVKVRFLEQGDDVWYIWTHQLPKKPGQQFGDSVACLDQESEGKPCPGCNRQKNRTARVVINLIWYDAPKMKRDGDGKVIKDDNGPVFEGTEDCVAVWNASQTVGGRLEHLHSKHDGLVQHIFEVTREGTKKDTKYMIDLDQKNQEPNAHEAELYKSKGDPRVVIKSLTFGDMERAYSGGGVGPDAGGGDGQAPTDAESNVFAKAASGAINRGAFGG